jgi:hypothetical protein
MHYLDKPENPEDLLHFGVRGMHWGVRKNKPMHADYGSSSQAYDRKNFGKGAVDRINNRMHDGKTIKEARTAEYKFRKNRRRKIIIAGAAIKNRKRIVAGAKFAATVVGLVAGVAAQHIAVKAETNRGRAAAANIMGIQSKGSSINYANKRKGAYNITNI